jgi:Golgi nucleoside diphosphatase
MFNLVESFLKKFNEGVNLSYSNILEHKEVEKKVRNEEKENIPVKKAEVGTRQLDISILPSFPHTDDSFYM